MPYSTQDPSPGLSISSGVVDHASDVFFHYRLVNPGGFRYVNPAIEALTGYPPDAFYADPDLHLMAIHPEDLPGFAAFLDQPQPSGKLAVRWVHTDGRIIPSEIFIHPLLIQDGQLEEYQAVVHVQGEAQPQPAQSADADDSLRQFIQACPAAIGILDLESGAMVLANPAFYALFQLTPAEAPSIRLDDSRLWRSPADFTRLVDRLRLGDACRNQVIQTALPAAAILSLEAIQFAGKYCVEIIALELGAEQAGQGVEPAEHTYHPSDPASDTARPGKKALKNNALYLPLRPSTRLHRAIREGSPEPEAGDQPAYAHPHQENQSTCLDAQALTNRRRYQRILNEITRSALDAASFEELLSTTVLQFKDFFRSDGCYISILNADGENILPAAASGMDDDQYLALYKYPSQGTITAAVLAEKHPLTFHNYTLKAPGVDWFNHIFGAGSVLALPLIAGEYLRGAVLIVFHNHHEFTPVEVEQGEQAASQIALALAQAHLFHDVQQKFKEIQFLHEVAQAGADALSVDDLLERVTELLVGAIHADHFGFLIADPQTNLLGYHPSFRPGGTALDLLPDISADSLASLAMRQEAPLRIHERSATPGMSALFPDTHAQLSVPIKIGGEVFGIIHLESHQPDGFTPADEHLMMTFAQQLATAIDKLRLHEGERLRTIELTAIAKISKDLRSAATIAEMIPVILDQVMKSSPARAALLATWNPDNQTGSVELGVGAWEGRTGQHFGPLDPICGPFLSEKPAVASFELAESDPPPAVQVIAGVKLTYETQITGVIVLGSSEPIQEDHLRLLSAIGSITSTAFHRSSLYEETQQFNHTLAESYDATIEGWARALELRDDETEGHSKRVVDLTIRLARRLGVPEAELIHIRRGALLHDIGKMGIPDRIFLKPGPLNEEEWVIMRRHPEYAYRLLAPIRYLEPALEIPHWHHERWDGTGYPDQLRGVQIPLSARIFAVVDVWGALTHDRPYRKAWSAENALVYIRNQSGRHFDPQVVQVFLEEIQDKVHPEGGEPPAEVE